MSSNLKKFTLAAGFVATLGYLVGCGTRGENTGFTDNRSTGPVTGLGSSSAAAAAGTTGSSLTGGTTGTPVVNDAFPLTVGTGLTISNMLATSGGSGNSNPPSRLAFATISSLGATRVAVVQGFGLPNAGRVVLMPRNPEATPGTSNIVLSPTGTGSDAAGLQALNNPFGITVDGETIFITDQSTNPTAGRVMVYDQITAAGVCRGRQILTTPPLANPVKIVKNGNFLLVAENATRGGGGRIRRIDLTKPFTGDATNSIILVDNVSNPTSIVLDNLGGRNNLYIAENAAGATGASGGIARVDLNQAPFSTVGGSLTTIAGGTPTNTASPGVTIIAATPTFNFPFDLGLDGFGNVVTTEGVSAAAPNTLISPQFLTGRIRVIQGGATPIATTATMVLQNAPPGVAVGMLGSRGVSLKNEDTTGLVLSAFFTEGVSLTTTCRQLTFRTTDGAIFRQIQLDSGKISPLDTLFDLGTTTAPVVAPNVKYTIGSFGGGTNGQVLDIR